LSPSWIQFSFILIEGVCLGLGEFYGLQCIPRESYEFIIPKGVIHLGEKFMREA